MASRQSAAVRDMYVRWAQELSDPDLDPRQRVENGEHWADITREPGGVDYIETDEPGRPAMWITPKTAAPDRVILVRLDVFPEQQHTFQMAAGYAPEADDALARFASWARPRLGL